MHRDVAMQKTFGPIVRQDAMLEDGTHIYYRCDIVELQNLATLHEIENNSAQATTREATPKRAASFDLNHPLTRFW
jgi:hypothetical protein